MCYKYESSIVFAIQRGSLEITMIRVARKRHLGVGITFFLAISLGFSLKVAADASWPDREIGAEAAGFTQQGIDELDVAMEKIVADNDVAGMVWLLAKDGKVATFQTAGYNRIETQETMELDSLFRIYSMTKPVTGVALMILYEEGYWEFEDPISKFLPELAGLQVMTDCDEAGNVTLVPADRSPTMRELLNHSAGFGYGLGGRDPVNEAFREQRVLGASNLEEMVSKIKDIPLLFQPGEEWAYSVAVDLQGLIVQRLTRQNFGDFLQQRIFEPLAMGDTRFYVMEEDRNRLAQVHSWDIELNRLTGRPQQADRPGGFFDPDRIEAGGSGLVSSTHDYARFLQMLVNEGELDEARILTPESIRVMRTNSLRDELLLRGTDTRAGSPGQGFGVDFAVIFDPIAANSPHGAGTYNWGGAAGTWFWVDPTQDMFWIGMIQRMGRQRPGAANMRNISRDIIYNSLVR